MDIKSFLKETNMKSVDFADKINRHPSYISKLSLRLKVPSLITALVIFRESKGKVNINDIIAKDLLEGHGLLSEQGTALIKFSKNK